MRRRDFGQVQGATLVQRRFRWSRGRVDDEAYLVTLKPRIDVPRIDVVAAPVRSIRLRPRSEVVLVQAGCTHLGLTPAQSVSARNMQELEHACLLGCAALGIVRAEPHVPY